SRRSRLDGLSAAGLRLLLEKSTEALPMGSRIRTAVGEDFEGALEILAGLVDARQEGPAAAGRTAAAGGGEARNENDTPVVFTAGQYAAAKRGGSITSKLLCSGFASAEDHVESISALPRSAQIERLQKLAAAADVDPAPLLSAFLRLAEGSDVSVESARHFLASIALNRPPASASSELGRLVGLYAKLSIGGATDSAIVDATSTVLLSIEGRDRVSVAAFVRGYTEAVSGAKQVENMISSLSRALSTDVILPRKQLPVMPKLRGGNDAKGAKAQLRAWKRWADKILPAKIADSDSDIARSESMAVARAEVENRVKESEPNEKETAETLLELRKEGTKDDKAALPTISEDTAADAEVIEVAPVARQKKRRKSSDASESVGKRGRGSARRNASDASDCSAAVTTPRRSRRRAGSDASETSTESVRLRRSTRRK
ncbi:hypothetical protein THAOC_31320, partial [Thalassiosira oceanica]